MRELGGILKDLPKTITGYVLKCEDGKYYVGVTQDLANRLITHVNGSNKAASWTKLYKPLELEKSIEMFIENKYDMIFFEDYLTYLTALEHGAENVRGGKFIYVNQIPDMNKLKKSHDKFIARHASFAPTREK